MVAAGEQGSSLHLCSVGGGHRGREQSSDLQILASSQSGIQKIKAVAELKLRLPELTQPQCCSCCVGTAVVCHSFSCREDIPPFSRKHLFLP